MGVLWVIMIIAGISALVIDGQGGSVITVFMKSGGDALKLCLELTSVYCVWFGIIGLAEDCGAVKKISDILKPLIKKLFGKKYEKAFGFIALNLSANLLGVSNAATPSAVSAMREFDRINTGSVDEKDTAGDINDGESERDVKGKGTYNIHKDEKNKINAETGGRNKKDASDGNDIKNKTDNNDVKSKIDNNGAKNKSDGNDIRDKSDDGDIRNKTNGNGARDRSGGISGAAMTFPMLLLFMLNLSGLQLIPTTVIGLRASYKSASPSDILLPNLVSTVLTTLISVGLAFLFSRKERGAARRS